MHIALISDLHGNELALRAVLADIERVGVDRIVCLGDVATLGPEPRAVLRILQDLGCSCILGNHDEFLLVPESVHAYAKVPIVIDAVDWCRQQLREDDLAFVRTFQPSLELTLDEGCTLLLFHGTPGSHTTDLLATTPADEVERLLEGRTATVMAGGHTHLQMLRQHRGTLLVNPGSVGMPFKEYVAGHAPTILSHAEYATVEASGGSVSVTLRRVALDRAALREAARASDNPLRTALMQAYA